MRTLQLSILLCIVLFNAAVLATPPMEPTWYPYWPFSTNTGIDEVHIGYGDWCVIDDPHPEGPHPGIDFGDPNGGGTMVYSLCAEDDLVQWKGCMQGSNGWVVVVAKPEDDWGWALGHIDVDDHNKYDFPSGTLPAFEEVDPTYTSLGHWPHVHLMWLEAWPTDSTYNSTGYYNPFFWMSEDPDLRNDLIEYDEVMFNFCYSPFFADEGLWFMPDESEVPAQFSSIDPVLFQSTVFGIVDVGASPYSAFNADPERDSVGVNTVGYKILKQNPYTGDYEDLDESSISIFGGEYRLLVSMDDGEMTLGDSPEYRALYVDGNTRTQIQEQNMRHHNAYILTNSGTQSMGSGVDGFNSGWDNVWTDSYNRDADWNDHEFLRGAWDTRLGNSNDNRTALVNNQAVFPDGKYAFDVRALSQGTAFLDAVNQEWAERALPREDPNDENSPVTGVVVDNYLPYVDSVIVYSSTRGLDPPRLQMIYAAGWEEDTGSNTAELMETVYGYLPLEEMMFDQLWIAVRYSEPMDTGEGDVWITAEMRAQQRWNSISDGEFIPQDTQSNWPQKFGPLETEELSGGMWQLYRYGGVWPREYNGRLTLHVKHSSEHPVDYGENSIDGDPSTIAEPRNADGSWSGIRYETEDDDSYEWGQCNWDVYGSGTSEGYFYAMVGNTRVQTVFFTELGLGKEEKEDEYLHVVEANIEYTCGAFVSKYRMDSGYIHGHHIRVIDGDGNWVGHTYLYGPCENSEMPVYYQFNYSTEGIENGSEWDNKYFWILFRFVYYHGSQARWESEEVWYGYNGHTGMNIAAIGNGPVVQNTLYFGDYCPAWGDTDSRGIYYINCNFPAPEYTVEDGWRIPVYYVNVGSTIPYYRGEMLIPTQALSDSQCLDDMCESGIDSRLEVHAFGIQPPLPNPASSSVVVRYSIENAGHYDIKVYDLTGRVHAELLHGEAASGVHSIAWDLSDDTGGNLPAGAYLIRLTGCGQEEIQKLIILE
jgi:hypothetical protein